MANLAPINEWGIGVTAFAPSYLDTTETHNGNPSIRMEGQTPYSKLRECDSKWIPVQAGQRLRFGAWIKTDTATVTPEPPHMGARIGLDFMFSTAAKGSFGVSYNPNGALPKQSTEIAKLETQNFYIPMGNGWTYRIIDVTVPATVKSDQTGLVETVYGVIVWFQVYTGYRDGVIVNETANAWISEPTVTLDEEQQPPPPEPDGDNRFLLVFSGIVLGFLTSFLILSRKKG